MIYLIGAGAIGKALAVMLQQCGKAVTLVRRNAEPRVLNVKVQLANRLLEADLPVATLDELGDGLVLVTAKSFANPQIAAKVKPDQPVVLLQNGLNIEKQFANDRLYRCVLFVTSQFDPGGVVLFKAVDTCPVGVVKGDEDDLNAIIDQLDNPWFRFRVEPDLEPIVWKKVISNCVFNSVCPLLDTDIGIFQRDGDAMAIAKKIIAECVKVAQQSGVSLSVDEVEATLLKISQRSDGQLISTLQDIRAGRPTEIGTLNGEIVRLAGELPVPYTRLAGELTDIKSQINLH